jgi:outer membrane receptor protein involved in Fe transport
VSDTEAATDAGRSIPRQIDETLALFEHGGFNRVQTDDASRIAMAVKLTNVFAQHELRYGVDAEINGYDGNVRETWYRYFGQSFDPPLDYIQERNYSVVGKGSTTNTALFVQDGWKVTPSLQLNLGLRYEIQKLDSATTWRWPGSPTPSPAPSISSAGQ